MKPLDPLGLELAGTSLIEASAGTGKTYTIATLYLRLLLEQELRASEILVLTYTRAATSELRDRIRSRIAEAVLAFESGRAEGDPTLESLLERFCEERARRAASRRLTIALANFDEAAILTIHGFCQRVLRDHAFESRSGFDVELLVDQNQLLREIVVDFQAQALRGESHIFVRDLRREHQQIDSLIAVAQRGTGAPAPRLIPTEAPADALAFDDLLLEWEDAYAGVREAWAAQGSELIELLAAAAERGDLHKGSYKPASIRSTWQQEMDEALADRSGPLATRFKRNAHFTTANIQARTPKKGTTPEHPFFERFDCLHALDEQLARALCAKRVAFERELIEYVEERSRTRKEELAQQSYDDLLAQVASALEGAGGKRLAGQLRSEYRAALVDEFQDTDSLQYRILRSVWPPERESVSPLFLIGDPKQAIYGFRGADVHAYLAAKQDAGARCFTLNVNYRSDPNMIRGVASLFGRTASPFRTPGILFESVTARPDARNVLTGRDEETPLAALDLLFCARPGGKAVSKLQSQLELPWRIAADIAATLQSDARIDGRAIRPNDIAILCRTNAQTRALCDALREIGIPAALLGNASVFDADEAREFEWVLDAVAQPGSESRVRAALATRLFEISAAEFDALQEDEAGWEGWLQRFRSWHDLWRGRGFIRMFHQLLRDAAVHRTLLATEGGERRLTNTLHLAELAERASLHDHLGQRGLVEWLARMRGDRSLRENAIGEEGELRLESDEDAVKVVTVHKSKGLEYPIVYCPYLWDGSDLRSDEKKRVRFHDPQRNHEIVLDLGSDALTEHLELATEEGFAEGVRLLYVSLTRAKHRCSVVWGSFGKTPAPSALRRLLHPSCEDDAAFKKLDDEALRSELEQFAGACGDAVGLRDLVDRPASRLQLAVEAPSLVRAEASRELSSHWRHSSFSALAASERDRNAPLPATREEGLDYDAVPDVPVLADERASEREIVLNALPAGAATGTLLHSILENLDFESPALAQPRDVVGETLKTHGFDAGWRERLGEALDRICETRWREAGPRLRDLAKRQRLDELEFLLPVAGGNAPDSKTTGMSVSDLADVFRRHADDPFLRSYAERLAQLRFEPLAGYLKGYIDLVFEWQGRFHVVDYKSNFLGPYAVNYLPSALEAPMAEHHYVLQYHLYSVALDRYLALRVPDYDYDEHFGGVDYLFLRGMDPDHPLGCGIHHRRPTRECIRELSALLAQPGERAA